MNETNIKHGYATVEFNGSWSQGRYFESRGAYFKSRSRIYASKAPGAQYWSQGRNTGAPRGWIF